MQLKKLTRIDSSGLLLLWDDGHREVISLKTLRDACPCAGCKGETVLGRHYGPPPIDYDAPGRYELKSATPVGNYAIRLSWGDQHADGMYSWELLRALCECEECMGRRSGSEKG